MILTLTTTHTPATDLGYLLHKHPDAVQISDQSFGRAVVFYPEATEARTTAALMLEIDPISLVRGRNAGDEGLLDQYVNDRPYVSSYSDLFRCRTIQASGQAILSYQIHGGEVQGFCRPERSKDGGGRSVVDSTGSPRTESGFTSRRFSRIDVTTNGEWTFAARRFSRLDITMSAGRGDSSG